MKLCITTPIYPPDSGGPSTYTYEIQKRLSEKGHEITIITTSQSARGSDIYVFKQNRRNSNLLVKLCQVFSFHFRFLLYLLKVAKNCDLIYAQTPNIGIPSLVAAKLLKKPVMLRYPGDMAWEAAFSTGKTKKDLTSFLRSPEGGVKIKFLIMIHKFAFPRMDKIVVPSQFLKKILTTYYSVDDNKVPVIYNAIDSNDCDLPRNTAYSTGSRLISVGRLVKHKNVDSVIRAVKNLVQKHPDIKLTIVGDGPERKILENLTEDLGLQNNVKFLGRTSRFEVIRLLSESDIFILNSVYEGLPHVVLEANACRVAVIATNIEGTNEVVCDGVTGFLVTPGNIPELADRIANLIVNNELREKFIENAYENVQNFTWDKSLEQLIQTMDGVINEKE
jgi:glycosyltransferase involved in cell wall biosynthesis